MSNNSEIPAHLQEYRKALVAAEQKAQEDFDKTVLSLSGGGTWNFIYFSKRCSWYKSNCTSQLLICSLGVLGFEYFFCFGFLPPKPFGFASSNFSSG